MSGGDGRLSKLRGFRGESIAYGARGFSPGVPIMGGAGRGGVTGDTDKFTAE